MNKELTEKEHVTPLRIKNRLNKDIEKLEKKIQFKNMKYKNYNDYLTF